MAEEIKILLLIGQKVLYIPSATILDGKDICVNNFEVETLNIKPRQNDVERNSFIK